ncbi:hypothetical protein FQA39_LY07119 [Lamprigera yunnana]|nr:hypothetical protein FQA39_LY07119 [Lamprigera yunnana]
MDEFQTILSLEDCSTILLNDTNDENIKALSYRISQFSNKIEGLLGQHFKLQIDYKKEENKITQQYFVKIINGNFNTITEICRSIYAYEKESLFYNVLLQEFKKLDINTDFVPRCYFTKPSIIVLEDLSVKGYNSANSVDFDIQHCKKSLEIVAKLHSCSLIYEAKTSTKFFESCTTKYPHLLESSFFVEENNLGKQWLRRSTDGIYELIKCIPENHILIEDFLNKFKQFVEDMPKIHARLNTNLRTILHNDLWVNNFLFKYEGNEICNTVLLDFQTIRYGPPMMDVMHFLYSNTRKTFRDKYFMELVDFYYANVKNNLLKYNYHKIPSKSEYLLLDGDMKSMVKFICLCDRTVTLLFGEEDISTFENDESLRRFLFEDRSSALVRCFKQNSNFRNIIEEDMLEFRDLLFEV